MYIKFQYRNVKGVIEKIKNITDVEKYKNYQQVTFVECGGNKLHIEELIVPNEIEKFIDKNKETNFKILLHKDRKDNFTGVLFEISSEIYKIPNVYKERSLDYINFFTKKHATKSACMVIYSFLCFISLFLFPLLFLISHMCFEDILPIAIIMLLVITLYVGFVRFGCTLICGCPGFVGQGKGTREQS